jgi:voltage-gated potassium channel
MLWHPQPVTTTAARRWAQAADVSLDLAAVAFLIAYAVPIIWPATDGIWAMAIIVTTWLIFLIDYLARVAMTDDRWRYIGRHWRSLIVVALPLLRPLRLLSVITLLAVFHRRSSVNRRDKLATYTGGGSVLIGFCAALAVLDAERLNRDANITTLGDALWWAVTTMTSVGYGDLYPITPTGRVVAAVLMVVGIAILGTVTATMASWLMEAVQGDKRKEVTELQDRIAELEADLKASEGRF